MPIVAAAARALGVRGARRRRSGNSPSLRPVTRLPHNIEHLAIFAITGATLGLGYPGRLLHHVALLVLFAGVIELAQFVTPGRHPRLIDFVVDAASACAGAALAALLHDRIGLKRTRR